MSSQQSRPNFSLFAVWRLFAACLVMIYHFSTYGPPFFQQLNYDMECLTPLLDMFFMISGFLIWVHYADRVTSWPSFKDFIFKRFSRLYPLHLMTLSFFCLVALAVNYGFVATEDPERYSLIELVKELLLINAWGTSDVLAYNYVSWSLSAEWFAYLAFPLLVFVHARFGLLGLVIQLGLTILALEAATAFKLMPFPTWLDANTWGAYRVLADFTLGAMLAECARRYQLQVRSHLVPWGLFFLAMLMMITGLSRGYMTIAVLALSLYVAARAEISRPEKSGYLKPFLPVANLSFGMYLWHPVLAVTMLSIGWRRILEPMDLVPFWFVLFAVMVITIVVAYISAVFFENPMRKWMLNKAGKGRADTKPAPVAKPREDLAAPARPLDLVTERDSAH